MTKGKVIDPLRFAEYLWPNVHFYNRQREIIYLLANDEGGADEVVVVAANKMGV